MFSFFFQSIRIRSSGEAMIVVVWIAVIVSAVVVYCRL